MMKKNGFSNEEIFRTINPKTQDESMKLWFTLGKLDAEQRTNIQENHDRAL